MGERALDMIKISPKKKKKKEKSIQSDFTENWRSALGLKQHGEGFQVIEDTRASVCPLPFSVIARNAAGFVDSPRRVNFLLMLHFYCKEVHHVTQPRLQNVAWVLRTVKMKM